MKSIVGDGEVVAWKARWTCHVVSSICREVETRCCTGQSRNFDLDSCCKLSLDKNHKLT